MSRAPAWPGLPGIFGKSLRDSRLAILLAAGILGFCVYSVGASTAANYPTVAGRQLQIEAYSNAPAVGALFGIPIGIDTLGGLVSWRDASLIVWALGLWSIVVMSGALAGEAANGSGDILAAMPLSRRRIAFEKLAAHGVAMCLIAVALAAVAWLTGAVFGSLPGDAISFPAALADFLGLGLLALFGGALAFALSMWFGRGAARGLAMVLFLGSFFVFAYQDLVPVLRAIRWLSPFEWTARNQPIAGSWDPLSLLPAGALVAALTVVGVEGFARRDLGAVVRLPRASLPGSAFLLRGPGRRLLLDTRGPALAWGLGLGLVMALIGVGSESVSRSATMDPASERFVRQLFGDTDWTSPAGLISLAMVWFGYVILAFATTTFVSALASDERQRRLDVLLSTPMSRVRWLVAGSAGVGASIGLMIVTMAVLAGAGAALGSADPAGPFLGILVAGGLYSAALGGLAVAVLGVGRAEWAGAIPAALGIGFFVVDTIANLLRLPTGVTAVCLTHYLGRPIAGEWDWPGMAILAAVAVGGVVVGASGIRRRDITK